MCVLLSCDSGMPWVVEVEVEVVALRLVVSPMPGGRMEEEGKKGREKERVPASLLHAKEMVN